MKQGLQASFELLRATPNEAANRLLAQALASPHEIISIGALEALLARGTLEAHREVIRALRRGGDRWAPIVAAYHGHMTAALREALAGADLAQFENACTAARWRRDYEAIGPLARKLSAAKSGDAARDDLAGQTLLALADSLAAELAVAGASDIRAPIVRQQVIANLEPALRNFSSHQRREILDAFLMLARREDGALRHILMEPHHEIYEPLLDELARSERPAITHLLLGYLDDPRPPLAILDVIARRSDRLFLASLLVKIGGESTIAVRRNLKRIESFPWIGEDAGALVALDGDEQAEALRLLLNSSTPRSEVYRAIERLLAAGRVEGRRAAIAALAEFSSPDADALAIKSLGDPDPEVHADAARQVRSRGLPGAIQHLIDLLADPHPAVRQAARQNLGEFTFLRFMAAYDTLDERARRSNGQLVRKVDPDTPKLLAKELRSPVRTSRLRALDVVVTIDLVAELEAAIIDLLDDEDYVVRVEAARALAHSSTPTARAALAAALDDESVLVQEAAEQSLGQILHLAPGEASGRAPAERPIEEHVHD